MIKTVSGNGWQGETAAILCPNELMINIGRRRQPGRLARSLVGPWKKDAAGQKEFKGGSRGAERWITQPNVGETQGCRINKLLPVVPPREQRSKIKDGHCCCQGHLIRAIYFLDLLIAEVFTGVLKQQKLTGTIREISRLRPFCPLLTLKTLHSWCFFYFLFF